MTDHRFRYVLDPVCLTSLMLYLAGRWYLRPHQIGGHFVSSYLNDVLCLPLFLPMILRMQRALRIRNHDEPPRLWEIVQHWVVFSIVFEIVVPRLSLFRSTADPYDVVAYLIGGLVAWTIWNRRTTNTGVAVAVSYPSPHAPA